MTVFDGVLRRSDAGWIWSDGALEPRVRDLIPDVWNFRCRTRGGATYVEVLRGVALETPSLEWVVAGARAGRYPRGRSGDHTGPRVLGGGEFRRAPTRCSAMSRWRRPARFRR